MHAETEGRELYAIADLAKEFNISTRTIRFYETKGLLAPERLGTTRVFRRRDHARLALILRGKRLGFSLKDIQEYLSLYDADNTQDTQNRRLVELVDQRMDLLNRQMEDLKITISELSEIKKLTDERLTSAAAE